MSKIVNFYLSFFFILSSAFVFPSLDAYAQRQAPSNRSPKSEIAIFRYKGAKPNTEAANRFDIFRECIEQKIINFKKELSQDTDPNVLDKFNEISLILKGDEDKFKNNKEINEWLKSQPKVLNLLRGAITSDDGKTFKVFSRFYLGELKGYLKNDIVIVDLPLTGEEFANTKDSHTVVILYSLAMEAKLLGFPKNEIAIILKAAENKISDLERRRNILDGDLLDLKRAITNASNELLSIN